MDLTNEFETKHFDAQNSLTQMGNYYLWILNNFSGAIGSRVWDAGAGIGNITELLSQQAEFVLATEFTKLNLVTLHKHFEKHENINVRFCDLTKDDALAFAKYDLDTIVTLDVLEHLENDQYTLRLYYDVLRPNGRLLIKVPAHMFLYGSLDKASLHFRRYAKKELKEKLNEAGFIIEKLHYMNIAATIPYFIKSVILKKNSNFSTSLNSNRLGFYNILIPWFEKVERILRPPFGLSLIAIGRKPCLDNHIKNTLTINNTIANL